MSSVANVEAPNPPDLKPGGFGVLKRYCFAGMFCGRLATEVLLHDRQRFSACRSGGFLVQICHGDTSPAIAANRCYGQVGDQLFLSLDLFPK